MNPWRKALRMVLNEHRHPTDPNRPAPCEDIEVADHETKIVRLAVKNPSFVWIGFGYNPLNVNPVGSIIPINSIEHSHVPMGFLGIQ